MRDFWITKNREIFFAPDFGPATYAVFGLIFRFTIPWHCRLAAAPGFRPNLITSDLLMIETIRYAFPYYTVGRCFPTFS